MNQFPLSRQHILFIIFFIIPIVIGGLWLRAFQALQPSPKAEEPHALFFQIPPFDWEFFTSFGEQELFVSFPSELPPSGRENPFSPFK